MSPKAQEELAGTSSETLRTVYDQMTVAEMRDEMQELLRTTA